ncbi:MAG: GvpL/GvpF family gas vesicle protein [Thermoanaerobaculia bacterium]
MKSIAIGAHLLRDDVEPLADAVPVGDLFLSAITIADEQALGDRELLLKIAGIRAKLLDVATFIAIRYGFTFVSVEEAQSKCLSHLARWKGVLTENRGNVEMSLKVAASSPSPRPDRHAFSSGAAYLRALHAATQAANVDPSFREAAERLIVPLATRHRWSHRDEKSVELTALVARERLDEVRLAGEELRRAAPHVPFLLSGPWPLEVFADDDHQ